MDGLGDLVYPGIMARDGMQPSVVAAASKLRAMILAVQEGTLIGSEEHLCAQLGVSRSTMRQAARLLEREGVLHVRHGSYGGYYSARPDLATIEAAVGAYLHTLDVRPEDATAIASTLWVEVVRTAAVAHAEAAQDMIATFRKRLPGSSQVPLLKMCWLWSTRAARPCSRWSTTAMSN